MGHSDKRVVKESSTVKRYLKKNVLVKHFDNMCYYENVISNDAYSVLNKNKTEHIESLCDNVNYINVYYGQQGVRSMYGESTGVENCKKNPRFRDGVVPGMRCSSMRCNRDVTGKGRREVVGGRRGEGVGVKDNSGDKISKGKAAPGGERKGTLDATQNIINSQNIKAVYCNMNGLSRKSTAHIADMLLKESVDIFAVSEHKKGRKQDIPTFNKYDRWASCREIEKGGETAIWIKKDKFKRVTTIPMTPINIEWEQDQTWIGIHTETMDIAIGVVYIRPVGPHCDKDELIEIMQAINVRVLELQEKNFKVMLLGDFNAKIKRTPQGYVGDNEAGLCLIDTSVINNLDILNFNPITKGVYTWKPEGKRAHQQESTLDYILHDNEIKMLACKIDEDRDYEIDSDHVPIIWEFMIDHTVSNDCPENREFWNELSEVDWGAYNSFLEYKLLNFSPQKITYDELYEAIHSSGVEIIGKSVPKCGKQKSEPRHIILARKLLSRARKKLVKYMKITPQYRDQGVIDHYRGCIWRCRQTVRDMERAEETVKTHKFMDSITRECDKNMKKLYTFMNKNKKPVMEKFGLKNNKGEWITKDLDIKNQLKMQWEKIYQSGHWPNSNPDMIMTDLKIDQDDIEILNLDVQKHEIDQALDQLHVGTSAGTTDIPPELLRNLGPRSRRYIWGWAQNTWLNNDPPEQNDMLRTIFLHKKGATDTLDNYRTLTTGCNLCKVFNRLLTNRIQEAVEESNILGEIQNGFRRNRRATDNLLVLETILRKTKREKKKILWHYWTLPRHMTE